MQPACQALEQLGVNFHTEVVSAHRTPEKLFTFARKAASEGVKVIIAGAGGAAHLPGMLAANTVLPVLGVPVQSKSLNGLDSLLSIVQMPKGVSVGTMAIGQRGAFNAGLLAAQIVGLADAELQQRIDTWRLQQTQQILDNPDPARAP